MDAAELRAKIEAADDLPAEEFPAPEWPEADGCIFVRGMDAGEADEHEVFLANHAGEGDRGALKVGTKHIRARVAVKGLVDKDGVRIFGDTEPEIAALSAKGLRVVDRIYDRVRALSGLGQENGEELEKNS